MRVSGHLTNIHKLVTKLRLGTGIWALADQGIVSMGTFAVSVLVARWLPVVDYGVYALLFGLIVLWNSVQNSLVIYPLSVQGATVNPGEIGLQAFAALTATSAINLPMGILALGVGLWYDRLHLAVTFVLALGLGQAQEVVRRSLMAQSRHRDALLGDIVSYLGQALVIWFSSFWRPLSLEVVFWSMALTSGMATLVQFVQVRCRSVSWFQMREWWRGYWLLGRWMLVNNLVNTLSVQAVSWVVAAFHGPTQVAALRAVSNVMGVTHPVLFGVGNIIVPETARVQHERGAHEARRTAFRYGAQGLVVLAPVYLVAIAWPNSVLSIFYGSTSTYAGLSLGLQLFAIAYALNYVSSVIASLLNGLQKTQLALKIQLLVAALSALVGLPMAAMGGSLGAIAGILMAAVGRVLISVVLSRRSL